MSETTERAEVFAQADASDILVRLGSLYNSFSPAQRTLADYILAHSEDVPFLSVHELAARTGVSVATVSRFPRMIGYGDLKKFKRQLGRERQQERQDVEAMYQEIVPGDSDEAVVEKVFRGNIRSLEDTLRIVERTELIRCAKILARARRIVFFGTGSSGYVAADAALRLSQLDLQAEAYEDGYHMLVHAARLNKSDVAFGISHSGRSAIVVRSLQTAQSHGATTVGLANYMKSPLHNTSDLFLCTSFPERRVKVAAISSRVAQTATIDAIYLLTARFAKIRNSLLEELDAEAETYLRTS